MSETIAAGSSQHVLADPRPGPRREITVFTHRPASFTPDSPVVLVIHGRGRNGADYRDWWVESSERHGALIVTPEFSERHYPHPDAYNYGGMFSPDRRLNPRAEWLWSVIDQVFEEARRRAASRAERYSLFGHSAGGQVVHRLATFGWSQRIERAIAANSGAYTMPELQAEFPYGLGGTGSDEATLRALLARPLMVLLGEADNDPNHDQLPREPAAMKQGPHRFARGHHYFEAGKRAAERLGVSFGWRLATVPGADHSGKLMSPAAARHFFEENAFAPGD
jgi:poly(3-hydroxybutyrate) depolymerase